MEKSEYMEKIMTRYSASDLVRIISKFKDIKVLTIGDAIVDEYHFTVPKGRAIKDPILSVDYQSHEVYAGGILAVANHVSNFVDKVTCLTVLGDQNDKKDFIMGSLNKNIVLKFFIKKNSPTTVKKRYLNSIRNEKLFKVEHIDDSPIPFSLENEFIEFLESELSNFDLVLIGDFGHGLITERLIEILEKKSNYLAINAQCNSANLGFNFVTKYANPTFMTMDIQELKYAVADRFSDVPTLMHKLNEKANFKKFLVTMGKDGSGFYNGGSLSFSPAFVTRPQDTIGAGDAVFSVTSLFAYSGNDELIPFIANCAGGIAVSYLGNKENINKENLTDFINQAYAGKLKVH